MLNMKRILLSLLLISQGITFDIDIEECAEYNQMMLKDYFNDNFLISRLTSENNVMNSLLKYLKISLDNVNKELQSTCIDFPGVTKEQSIYCPDRPLNNVCRNPLQYGSGVYHLKSKIHDSNGIYLAYCLEDINGGEPWTIIQRRLDDNISFNRSWNAYRNGFGNIFGSYWLGLEEIYTILNSSSFELWIELKDFENSKQSSKFDEFIISSESLQYALENVGKYTGTAGDSLKTQLGREFSTFDKLNNEYPCANLAGGGWWFSDCGYSNLNGIYYDHQPNITAAGIFWYAWKGSYTYKYAHMAIRERI